jgi:hypothetical protein
MVSGLNTWNECYLQIEWAVEVCSCPKSYVQLIVSFLNKQVGAPTVPSAVILKPVLLLVKSCQIMLLMSNHVLHVKSCYSYQIMLFMSNHVIHVKSCHSCQIMKFMSNLVIHVKSCYSCQIMSLFMSNNVIIHVKSCHHSCHSCHTCCNSCHSCQDSCSLVI